MTKTEILEAIDKKKDELIKDLLTGYWTPTTKTAKRLQSELAKLKQQLLQLNSPINKPDFFDSKIGYCAKCAAKMKLTSVNYTEEAQYICMNPECDDYLKAE